MTGKPIGMASDAARPLIRARPLRRRGSSDRSMADRPSAHVPGVTLELAGPWEGYRSELARERGHVVERPLLADLATVSYFVDIDRIP
jgi:hypothetical protein